MLKKCLLVMALAVAVSSCKKDADEGLENEDKLAMNAELKATLPDGTSERMTANAPLGSCMEIISDSNPMILGEEAGGPQSRGVAVKGTKWANGKVLRVFFLNGTEIVKEKVINNARKWANYANLRFVVTENKAESDIRVGFGINGSTQNWSQVGTDANNFKNRQTMNFGALNRNSTDKEFGFLVLHEFGHAIGLGHEHLSPMADIKWNKQAVYNYYMSPPDNWTRAQVNQNVFNKYKPRDVRNTAYDPESIMHYPIIPEFTTDGSSVAPHWKLSEKDKVFIKRIYPE